jgi:hypothetical protein
MKPTRVRALFGFGCEGRTDSFLFYVEDDVPGFDLSSVQRRSSGLALVTGRVASPTPRWPPTAWNSQMSKCWRESGGDAKSA